MKRFAACLFLALSACGAEASGAPQNAADPVLPMREIAPDFTVVAVPPDDDGTGFADLARDICGEKSYCKVGIWTDPGRLPTGLPMTERQVDDQAFMYTRNRATGFEQIMWLCTRYPQPNPANCFPPVVRRP
ncbi:MAG: hypothetical protein ACOH1E_06035, partial [Brevundimonas sp.]